MNRFTFERKNYEDEQTMVNDVHILIDLLIKNNYVIKIFDDGCCIEVSYDSDDFGLCESRNVWIPMDKFEDYIAIVHEEKE